jgi:hypothetical protein
MPSYELFWGSKLYDGEREVKMIERTLDIPAWGVLVVKVFSSLSPDEQTQRLLDGEPNEQSLSTLRHFHDTVRRLLAEVQYVRVPDPFRRAHDKLTKSVKAAIATWDALRKRWEFGLRVVSSGMEDRGSVRRMLQAEKDVQKRQGEQQKALLEFAREFVRACTLKSGVKEQLNLPDAIDEFLANLYVAAVSARGRL